ncbi:hypothetical protein DB43_GE00050 [Parachlamydia acanthamoebae]|nr:hypothetical protein DB43_GE00050 [Parachlamydia acanthamoebae]
MDSIVLAYLYWPNSIGLEKEVFMNRDVLETNWVQVREILREKFSNLSEDDIRQINGRYDQLVAKLQQKYGYSKEEAEERIRSWNFDRITGPRDATRDEKLRREDANTIRREDTARREDRVRREEDNSTLFKWLLGLGIPLLLLATYFLSSGTRTPEVTRTPTATQEQFVVETPADRAISSSLRNAFLSQPNLASELQTVQITTHNGVVTLSGSVSSREISDFMTTSAQNASGVNQVINNLQIR